MRRILIAILLPFSLASFLAGAQDGGKASPWKPLLPEDAYTELTARSIKLIEETSKSTDKSAADRIEVEAAILTAYSLSSKDAQGKSASLLRGAARKAAEAARKGKFKDLAEFGKSIPASAEVKEVKDFKPYLSATEPMMKMFLSKAKGGEGIHPDLHYQVKLKNLNGIEALLSSLASKKLNDENLAKVSKELPLLGYRIAAVGAITHELAPAKDADKWRAYSITMRDESIRLAESAATKNADGILKAATALENSCIECHSGFKNR